MSFSWTAAAAIVTTTASWRAAAIAAGTTRATSAASTRLWTRSPTSTGKRTERYEICEFSHPSTSSPLSWSLTLHLPPPSQRHAALPGGALWERQEVSVADAGEPGILHPQQALQPGLHRSGAHLHRHHVYQQHARVPGQCEEAERSWAQTKRWTLLF